VGGVSAATRGEELLELQRTLYASRNPTRRWLHTSRRDWIEDALRRAAAAGPAGSAIEVGPGSGVYLPLLCELFERVTALDVEPQFLVQAERLRADHPNMDVVAADVADPRLPSGAYDLALCSEVIEHVEDSRPALRALRRLLRPGGTLVLSTPQRHSPLELLGRVAFRPGFVQLARLAYREPVLPTGHVNLLTRAEVASQLADAGFRVRERFASGVYLPLVAELGGRAALRLEQRLERRVRGTRLEGLLWTQYWVAEAA
jgi:SAM-dependent methyltransferase